MEYGCLFHGLLSSANFIWQFSNSLKNQGKKFNVVLFMQPDMDLTSDDRLSCGTALARSMTTVQKS